MRNLFTFSAFVIACTGSPKDERNHEAIMLHNSMLRKADLIKQRLNELSNDSSNVNQDSVKTLVVLFQRWEADLVEVAGNENHTHHGHNDAHQPAPEVTAEQMIAIQKEHDARLSAIGQRASALKPDSTKDEHEH